MIPNSLYSLHPHFSSIKKAHNLFTHGNQRAFSSLPFPLSPSPSPYPSNPDPTIALLLSKAMAFYLVFTALVGLCSVSSVAELLRLEQQAKADGSLSFLVVGDWGRRGSFNQSRVALQVHGFFSFYYFWNDVNNTNNIKRKRIIIAKHQRQVSL